MKRNAFLPIALGLALASCNSQGVQQSLNPPNAGTWLGVSYAPTTNGPEKILYQFNGNPNGRNPVGGLTADAGGALYGTTEAAGAHAQGTVFRLTPSGSGYTESVLYSFLGGTSDGSSPRGDLTLDGRGNIFGTTPYGGRAVKACNGQYTHAHCGVVFELQRGSSGMYRERVLYRFKAGNDGFWPFAGLWGDSSGNWYGTTLLGGAYDCGVVYELKPVRSHFRESVIYRFTGGNNCGPFGPVIGDGTGTLYGTAEGTYGRSYGVVFKLTPGKTGFKETVLHTFNGVDGWRPSGTLALDRDGTLYGATIFGGNNCDEVSRGGCGNVYKLMPEKRGRYTYTVIHIFTGIAHQSFSTDGAFPIGGVARNHRGVLYGTTEEGGNGMNCNAGCGTVFAVKPGNARDVILYSFGGPPEYDGWSPLSGVLLRSGSLFGTTNEGGRFEGGTAYQVRIAGSQDQSVAEP